MSAQQPDREQLDELAWNELDSFTRELGELAIAPIPAAEFHREFLLRMVVRLNFVGGALWVLEDGRLRVAYQYGLPDTGLVGDQNRQRQHRRLLHQAIELERPQAVPPCSTTDDEVADPERANNSSEYLQLLAPLRRGPNAIGVVELFQRPDVSARAQENYLQFLAQVCDLPESAVTAPSTMEASWSDWHGFARAVQANLDVRATAYAIVNEGRRLLSCDRVTLLAGDQRGCRVLAVSGQDVFDRRSSVIHGQQRLASVVLITGDPLWHADGEDSQRLPPQVESALHDYLEIAQTKLVAVLPLSAQVPSAGPAETRKSEAADYTPIVGAWILERFATSGDRERLAAAAHVAGELAAPALANALRHEGLFLMPLWRTLGRGTALFRGRALPKTLAALAVVAAALLAMFFIPADFALEARGTLVPVVRRDVFARVDGDVVRVAVRHGDRVGVGDVLVDLRNSELGVRGAGLEGDLRATDEQLKALEQALLDQKVTEQERPRLHSERVQLTEKLSGLRRQLELHKRQSAELRVTSPIAGQVVTWDVEDRLPQRPVRRGERLLTLIDPAADWELELRMSEDRMGHIDRASQAAGGELPVRFVTATDPGRTHQGRVRQVERHAQVRGTDGNTVLLRVAIDRVELADPRFGAEVTAQVGCGRRSLGYVWLHEVIGFVQRRILFRL